MFKELVIIIITIFMVIYILTHYPVILNSVLSSFTTWKENIFPALFPMFVLSKILVDYDFIYLIPDKLKTIFGKIFKINPNTFFVFVMSLLTGFPSSSKYALDLYTKKLITKDDINKIILFTHFANPIFIIGTIGYTFFNNYEIGILILISHYLSNIVVGLLFRNTYSNNEISFQKDIKPKNFGVILSSSISSSIDTLFMILGTISFFSIISSIIGFNAFLTGILEMSNGIKKISMLSTPLFNKAILSCFILSFGGFSVHIQNLAILNNIKIDYFKYLLSRIIQGIVSIIIFLLLYC